MKDNILEIDKAIFEIKPPKIDYHLFENYRDFMSNRHIISYYKFENQFLTQLLALIESTFESKGRFNRSILLETLNSYIYSHKSKLDITQKVRIFNLIKQSFERPEFPKSIQYPAYLLLVNLPLFSGAEKWICKMATEFDPNSTKDRLDFINRILRYPTKSKIISNWIAENYHSDKLQFRRAEAVSWMLNENPNFVVESSTLIDDFESANKIDKETIQTRINFELKLVVEMDLEEKLIVFDNYHKHTNRNKLIYRPYVYLTFHYTLGSKPDFAKVRAYFYSNIEKIKNQTMLWSVAYSHLPKKEKLKPIKQFYQPDLFAPTFNIAKKHKLIELLEWWKI